jgi:hypothetical protein
MVAAWFPFGPEIAWTRTCETLPPVAILPILCGTLALPGEPEKPDLSVVGAR